MIKDKLKELPNNPGCYLMKNSDDEVIYVGKAKNLSNRVRSYFTGSHNAKTTRLVQDIKTFEFIITSTEKEAFILEMNLIKKYNPKYNIMLTDDKRYPYIAVSNEKNPKIYYTRDLGKKAKYFGPYPNAKAAKEVCDMLNKMYPLRKCNKIPKKECLYYHIGQCLAPCIRKVEDSEYKDIVNKLNLFLKGNVKDEIKRLTKLMNEASEKLEFEIAMEYLNLIENLKAISERQKMEFDINDADVFNYAVKDSYIDIQVFHLRDSKIIERNGSVFEVMENPIDMFKNFIRSFYLINNNPIPKEIILPIIDEEYNFFEESIDKKVSVPKMGRKKELLDLVLININKELDNLILKESRKYERTTLASLELGKILGIDNLKTIEAFDNSNIQGTSSVSAMVSFVDGVKNPKGYRKYRVKTVEGANDVGTFKEIIYRRYKRLIDEDSKLPDLIIIDGGVNQVNASKEALEKAGASIKMIGLIKDDHHKTSSLLYEDKIIDIDKKSNVFLFLESIQDEVHRFAISFHKDTRSKNMFVSGLDKIKGIGKVKKEKILKILGDDDFESKLNEIGLTDSQIIEIKKLYNKN